MKYLFYQNMLSIKKWWKLFVIYLIILFFSNTVLMPVNEIVLFYNKYFLHIGESMNIFEKSVQLVEVLLILHIVYILYIDIYKEKIMNIILRIKKTKVNIVCILSFITITLFLVFIKLIVFVFIVNIRKMNINIDIIPYFTTNLFYLMLFSVLFFMILYYSNKLISILLLGFIIYFFINKNVNTLVLLLVIFILILFNFVVLKVIKFEFKGGK